MEPDRQVEIQLGHMCNNRCVFCVSGQRTELREAFPLAAEPIVARIREAHAAGMRKLTLLGGEPTLQPSFLAVVREAVRLGFDEIVIFTNGAKTARGSFVDELLATGGNFTFRLSLQGATEEAHDRTTLKPGSFRRLLATMAHLRERKQRLTVNMCVVRSNFESVPEFPALLLPAGAVQLHLDMVRPLDAGVRSEAELVAMVPRYSELAAPLAKMVEGFPRGFDVNLGNLPFCIAPSLAPFIHHDGEPTLTVAVDGNDELSEPWDKYAVKRRDKVKPASCASCLLDSQCSGVFETYRRIHGLAELQPITAARLGELDPRGERLPPGLAGCLAALEGVEGLEGPAAERWAPAVDLAAGEVRLSLAGAGGPLVVALRRPDAGPGIAGSDRFSLHLLEAPHAGALLVAQLARLVERLCAGGAARLHHPVGADAGLRSSLRLAGGVDAPLAACLGRLRAAAPFGTLTWQRLSVDPGGTEATLALAGPGGAAVQVHLARRDGRLAPRYELGAGTTPSPALADGVRALFEALRG